MSTSLTERGFVIGKVANDPTKRKAYYATFEKIVTDELPIVFINQVPYHTGSSQKLGNVPTTIWGPLSPYDEVYFK